MEKDLLNSSKQIGTSLLPAVSLLQIQCSKWTREMGRERRCLYFIDVDKEAWEEKWLTQDHMAGKQLRKVQNSGFLTPLTYSPDEDDWGVVCKHRGMPGLILNSLLAGTEWLFLDSTNSSLSPGATTHQPCHLLPERLCRGLWNSREKRKERRERKSHQAQPSSWPVKVPGI